MHYARPVLIVAAASIALAVAAPSHSRKKSPTFAQDVAPILYAKCANCHHPGEVAPFSLITYEQAKNMAPTIASAVSQKVMPPWQASSHGEFANERTLTADQISILKEWAAAGAPAGDLKKAPPTPTFTPGWLIGKPDFVGELPKPYEVSAEGADDYRCFVIPTNFSGPRYVSAVEVRPGNRRVVHHVIAYIDTSGAARKKQSADGKPGYASFGGPGFAPSGSLGGWAPGLQPQVLGSSSGFLLPKGADIVLQLHYHKDGKAESDFTKIGLKFADGKVDKQVRFESVGEEIFRIPAGDSKHEVTATMKLDHAVTILDVLPHMHLLGHDMIVVATLPDGTKKPLIDVEHYDFNWQTSYKYRSPIHLPAGSELSLVAHYDNSTANLHNPNQPPKEVTFGEQTTDEMCYAFFSYTYDDEHLAKGVRVKGEEQTQADKVIAHIFDKFDADHDGFLSVDELAEVIRFFDKSGTSKMDPKVAANFAMTAFAKTEKGKLTRAEFKKLVQQTSNQ